MTHVSLHGINVRIPLYDSSAMRLLRMPSLGRAKVGTRTVSHTGATFNIHALSEIDLELREGDRVCVMGHNGAGKTTLLRVIAGIYPPTSGQVDVSGKVMALLGGNLALNPDASGYENIRLMANLYDWPKSKLPDYTRDIEEFTELGEYLALPVRIYSLGMLARLSFAMATMQAPDVLLIDEGIGAGDAQFQAKAEARANNFISQAKIMVLASHAVELGRAMCNKAVVLDHGSLLFIGSFNDALQKYVDLH